MIRSVLFALTATIGMATLGLPAQAAVDIQEVTTESGITAWLVEDHTIPFVALELRFRGGASLDQAGKRGAVNLMSGLLEEGTGELDARAFARALEEQAAEFSYEANDDSIGISAKFLTETKDEALKLLKGSIIAPRFDDDAIERVRGQILSIISSDLRDPNEIADQAFGVLAFADHPYGSAEYGTEESVSALTRDDVVAAHKSVFAKDRVIVSAVGDISAEDLTALIDDLLGDLPDTSTALPAEADLNLPGGVKVVDFETPQSSVLFAQPGLPRDHPDFFAAFILNHIVGGGGFESRLMTEVREKRGLTYGVYSYLVDKDNADLWMGSVASANNRVAEAVSVIRDQWALVHENGVTQEELDDAKTYLTGAYPLRFDSNNRIANITAGMQLSELDIDYIATRNDRVEAVTLEDINRVAKELMDPESLTFVVVGQPEGLESSIN